MTAMMTMTISTSRFPGLRSTLSGLSSWYFVAGQSELGYRPVSGVGPRLRGGFEKARVALGAPNDEVSEMNILGVFV